MIHDRTQIPQPGAPRVFNFPSFSRFFLKNGLEVLFAPHTKLPLVTLQLCVKSGASFEAQSGVGIASFTADLLPESTSSRSSIEISNAFEHYGIAFGVHADWDGSYLEFNSTKDHVDKGLDVFCDVLYNPSFPNQEIERQRKQLLSQRVRVADSTGRIAAETFLRNLYRGSRFAFPVSGVSSDIRQFDRNKLNTFYRQYYAPQNSVLIMVGDLNDSGAHKLAEKYFGAWKGVGETYFPQFDYMVPMERNVVLIHKEGAQQAELRMGHLGIQRENPDYFAVALLNQVLGGYFLSRLNMNLREDKGFTYGISSRFFIRRGLGPFIISAAVDSRNIRIAIEEILKEIDHLRSKPISDEELGQVKGYMTGVFPIAFESGVQIAAGLSNIAVYGLDDDYYQTYRNKISAVTANQILEAAKKYLHPDKMLITVAGDKDQVAEDLKSAFDVNITQFSEQ